MSTKKQLNREKRHIRIRKKIKGTAQRPRLVIFRSLSHIYAQLVDDEKGHILAESSDLKLKTKGKKADKAKEVGIDIAKKASDKKITEVIFDRGGYKYHGRVKNIAESARKGGLKF